MASQEFAYRPILQDLTVAVNDRGLDPYEAYAWLYEAENTQGLHAEKYCSTSITSGGHARDDSLEMREVIVRNTESARLLAEQLAVDKQLKPETAVEPVFVGKTYWNQAEFMEFWLSVIGGFRLTPGFAARDIDTLRTQTTAAFAEHELDIDKMIGKAPAEERAEHYFKMSSAFASLIKAGADAQPIQEVIRMIDTDKSLGSQTERIFARQIGSRVMNITVMQTVGPEALLTINRRLALDTAQLIQFGATVFDTHNNRVRLVLTEHEEEAA